MSMSSLFDGGVGPYMEYTVAGMGGTLRVKWSASRWSALLLCS